jgi:hypothetical protein
MKLLYGLLFCSFVSNASVNDYLPYAKSFTAGYATLYAAAYAHNLGHAVAAKTLFNVRSTVTVPVLALWKSKIDLQCSLPTLGFKRALFEAAGCAFSLATLYASLKLSSMVNEYSQEKSLLQTIKDGYNKPLLHKEQDKGVQGAVVAGVLCELMHLVPLKCCNKGRGNDGYQFLRALHIIS